MLVVTACARSPELPKGAEVVRFPMCAYDPVTNPERIEAAAAQILDAKPDLVILSGSSAWAIYSMLTGREVFVHVEAEGRHDLDVEIDEGGEVDEHDAGGEAMDILPGHFGGFSDDADPEHVAAQAEDVDGGP